MSSCVCARSLALVCGDDAAGHCLTNVCARMTEAGVCVRVCLRHSRSVAQHTRRCAKCAKPANHKRACAQTQTSSSSNTHVWRVCVCAVTYRAPSPPPPPPRLSECNMFIHSTSAGSRTHARTHATPDQIRPPHTKHHRGSPWATATATATTRASR